MNCPMCKTALKAFDRQATEIDVCLQCRGVWLDRGELEQIIDRTVEEAEGQRVDEPGSNGRPKYRDHADDRDPYHEDWSLGSNPRRQRKSLVGELFHF